MYVTLPSDRAQIEFDKYVLVSNLFLILNTSVT